MSKVIPNDWSRAKLGDYIGVQGGNAFKSEYFSDNGVPIIRISNIKKDGSVNLKGAVYFEKDSNLAKFKAIKGDILIAMSGATTGKVGRYKSDVFSYINQRVGRFFLKKTNEGCIDFIHQITSEDEFTNSVLIDAVGGAQPNISNQQIESILVNFPPLSEQKKIAKILTSVDGVIEKTQAQIDKLKDLKTGMMQELLTNGIGHTEFKDSPVGRIPAEWSVDTLDSISKVIDCKHATPKYYPVGYAVVKPGNIKEGNLDLSSCALTDKAGFDNLNENHLPVIGDTIYSRNQTYGIGAYVNKAMSFAVGQDVCIIHPKKCEPKFTYYVVNSPVVREQVELLAAGSTFKRINLGSIRKLFIPVPTKTEQVLISNALSSIDEKMEYILAKLKSLKMTKKALMQDLLTGKVRVKVS